LQNPLYNKGCAFEYGERDRLGLRGLIPPRVLSFDAQKEVSDMHMALLNHADYALAAQLVQSLP
jgi:hypothetical protein